MTIQRMENVGVGVDRVVGLDSVRVDVAMVRTPGGHGRRELMKFHTPAATTTAEPSWCGTRTATGSATSAAPRASSLALSEKLD